MESFRKLLRCKLHKMTVTQADVNYEGSITIPAELLKAANLAEAEAVNVWNVTRGTRFETYTIKGEANSGICCINGAAAHLVEIGDKVIVAAFGFVPESLVAAHKPVVVFVDEHNKLKNIRAEIPGPKLVENE